MAKYFKITNAILFTTVLWVNANVSGSVPLKYTECIQEKSTYWSETKGSCECLSGFKKQETKCTPITSFSVANPLFSNLQNDKSVRMFTNCSKEEVNYLQQVEELEKVVLDELLSEVIQEQNIIADLTCNKKLKMKLKKANKNLRCIISKIGNLNFICHDTKSGCKNANARATWGIGKTIKLCKSEGFFNTRKMLEVLIHETSHLCMKNDATYFDWQVWSIHNTPFFGWQTIADSYRIWSKYGFCYPEAPNQKTFPGRHKGGQGRVIPYFIFEYEKNNYTTYSASIDKLFSKGEISAMERDQLLTKKYINMDELPSQRMKGFQEYMKIYQRRLREGKVSEDEVKALQQQYKNYGVHFPSNNYPSVARFDEIDKSMANKKISLEVRYKFCQGNVTESEFRLLNQDRTPPEDCDKILKMNLDTYIESELLKFEDMQLNKILFK